MTMETPAQRCARIVSALEDLVAQEAAALRAHDFAGAAGVQERAAPLVEFLVQQSASASADPVLLGRIQALQERRKHTGDWLAGEIDHTRDELQQTNVAQRRVAQIAPVYGRGPAARSQLHAVG